MKFLAKTGAFLTQKTDCLVIPVVNAKKQQGPAAELNSAADNLVDKLQSQGELGGKPGDCLLLVEPDYCAASRLLLVSIGKEAGPLSADVFDKLVRGAATAVAKTRARDVTLCLSGVDVSQRDEAWKARQTAKIFNGQCYRFNQMKSEKVKPLALKKGLYLSAARGAIKALQNSLAEGEAIAEGMSLTRDLGNLPGNVCTPKYLAAEARKLARTNPALTSKILNEKQMRELGMHSLLSVSSGSEQEAQLIIMEYRGAAKTAKPVVLVGKGITFDTGGISLKPGPAMDEMKFDMCGAASVFGVMKSVLELQLPINLVGMVAAAENMPDGRASKPGDIFTSMSGQTIEVLNTDAEGRLVLCDALTYAERFKPGAVIDIATLTGACIVALGNHATGLFSNDDDLAKALVDASLTAGDKAWRMPLWDEYQEQLKSNFADIPNIGTPGAGAVTAACFLSRFTKNYKWAHLDIAGTASLSGSAKGATGRPVAMLVEYLKSV